MRSRAILLILFFAGNALAQDTNFFDTFRKLDMPPARIYSISPAAIRAGIVTELVVQGENFRPRNDWNLPGVRVLKERYVDSKTMILTVLAQPQPGLKSLATGDSSYPFEVQSSTILLQDDFEDGEISGWSSTKGAWQALGGALQVSATRKGMLFPTLENTDNFTMEWDMTLLSGKAAGIFFHYRDNKNLRSLFLDGAKGVIALRDTFRGNVETRKKYKYTGDLSASHHYLLSVVNNVVSLSIDGLPFFTEDLGYIYRGQLVLYAKAATVRFDNIVVSHDDAANVVPIPDFTYLATGGAVEFNANGSMDPDGNILSYSWNYGDGATGAGLTSSHNYTSGTTFGVVLEVVDNSGARTKIVKSIAITVPNEAQQIMGVVEKFFVLLKDLEWRSPQDICQDFSRSASCTGYDKQVGDLADGQSDVKWFDVLFYEPVQVNFQSATVAYPVKSHNRLLVERYSEPGTIYYTEGIHTYKVVKEGDGKWHQCAYTFQTISTNEP